MCIRDSCPPMAGTPHRPYMLVKPRCATISQLNLQLLRPRPQMPLYENSKPAQMQARVAFLPAMANVATKAPMAAHVCRSWHAATPLCVGCKSNGNKCEKKGLRCAVSSAIHLTHEHCQHLARVYRFRQRLDLLPLVAQTCGTTLHTTLEVPRTPQRLAAKQLEPKWLRRGPAI